MREDAVMASTPGPTILRRRLGNELRKHREEANISRVEAANHVGIQAPTMSKIEHGKQNVSVGNLRSLISMYKVGEAAGEAMLTMARQASRKDWWNYSFGATVPEWFRIYAGLEADAQQICAYESEAVPGVLQTPNYAAAVRVGAWPDSTEVEVLKSVAFRSDRQKVMFGEQPTPFHAVINEAVLHRIVGDAALMREQLQHLLQEAKQSYITLQVLPFSVGAHPGMNGAFSVMQFEEPDLASVYVEVESGALYLEREIDLDRYKVVFGRLSALALDEKKSAALIAKVARQL
jgi:DNA-binding XRE family transcriptional regulator